MIILKLAKPRPVTERDLNPVTGLHFSAERPAIGLARRQRTRTNAGCPCGRKMRAFSREERPPSPLCTPEEGRWRERWREKQPLSLLESLVRAVIGRDRMKNGPRIPHQRPCQGTAD